MATAKIATLAIRTLAKPIATQIKHQAQSHQRFRAICIGLAQFMHRTEMALRSNLLATNAAASDGEKPKVRPLNEAKAVTNGANALAEGFLFALAAALIMGESYRGSRSRAKQRDRTEEGLEEIRMITQTLAEKIGVDFEEIQRKAREAQEIDRQSDEEETSGKAKKVEGEVEDDSRTTEHESMAQTLYRQRQASEHERERLQHAVNVLLTLALKSGWIQGAEALHLEKILDGSDEHTESKGESGKRKGSAIEASSMQQQQQQPSPILARVALLQEQQRTTR